MGQYYKTVIETKNGIEVLHPHEYNNGLKLMEHSWVGNRYCNAVVSAIITNPMCRVAHMGDYSENYPLGTKKDRTRYYNAAWGARAKTPEHYPSCNEDTVYIVDFDKREYISYDCKRKDDEWTINPLTLLVAVGNGSGGGDDRGADQGVVGRWAFDRLQVVSFRPDGDCIEVCPHFKEE